MPRSNVLPALQAMFEQATVTPVWLLEIADRFGNPVRLSSSGEDVMTNDSPVATYLGNPGFNMSSLTLSLDGFPATVDIEVPIDDEGPIFSAQVKRGVWRKATAALYLADMLIPDNKLLMATGFLGTATYSDSIAGTMEFATKGEQLGDILLDRVQPKCNYVFGSLKCGFDLSTRELSGTVATVTSDSKFTVTISNPGNWNFNHGGGIKFTSGDNSGDARIIRKFTSGSSLIELIEGFSLDVEVGDTFIMHAGCARTRTACSAYGRLVSFSGYDYTPGELYGGL